MTIYGMNMFFVDLRCFLAYFLQHTENWTISKDMIKKITFVAALDEFRKLNYLKVLGIHYQQVYISDLT